DADPLRERAEHLERVPEDPEEAERLVEVKLPRDEADVATLEAAEAREDPRRGLALAARFVGVGLDRDAAEEAGEAVEAVVPVVVARDAEQDARARLVVVDLEEGAAPRRDEAAVDLLGGGDGVGDVAAHHEEIAAWQDALAPFAP